MQVTDYIKPELLVVAIVLYFLGRWMEQSRTVELKYISMINGVIGILICSLWVFANCSCNDSRQVAMAAFTAITQGILIAGLSTYVDQIIKYNIKSG